jgi:protein-tyrosine-phosphatase
MAEGLIRQRVTASGLSSVVAVSSAGTWATPDLPPTAEAVKAMAERGSDISHCVSCEVGEDNLAEADLVLVMTDGHRQAIVAEFPDVAPKVRLISSLAGAAFDIADPIGGGLDDYRATATELDRLIATGWDEIIG